MRPAGKIRRMRARAGPYSSTHRATRSWLKRPLAPCTHQTCQDGKTDNRVNIQHACQVSTMLGPYRCKSRHLFVTSWPGLTAIAVIVRMTVIITMLRIVTTIQRFPAHDELGTCRTSLVSPEQPVLWLQLPKICCRLYVSASASLM